MGPHALCQGCQVPHPSKENLRREDKEEVPGRVTVLEILEKIDEQVGIYEQFESMRESGESAIFSIQKIKAVLICYLNEGQC